MKNLERPGLPQRLVAEAVGTALLLATVLGSGMMAENLAGGNVALALLCNAIATGAGLAALILMFGSISGAHFNPAVSLAEAMGRRLPWSEALAFAAVQCSGAVLGVWLAHAMFNQPLLMVSQHVRAGGAQALSEVVATFGLLCTILGTARRRPDAVPFAVAAYIVAAYWFTASTSFANPAVTIARSLTDTFAGIRPADVVPFVGAQLIGTWLAVGLFRWLQPQRQSSGQTHVSVDALVEEK
jgi:glycerol uptake facilitator-like aquaporin